jgi:beta-glucosidase
MPLSPRLVAFVLGAVLALQAGPVNDMEHRIDDLLARMTLDEKIGQMSQSTAMATPISARIKAEIRNGRWGSFLNAGSPADRAEAQRIAVEESRLRIPLLFGRDVIHGYRTIFPVPIGQSSSWDPELVRAAAREAAREAASEGVHWTFAPMLDITRDPRWRRVAETLGEDPYLASVLGAAMVQGFQGESLKGPGSIASCIKHFAGYGAAEAGRDYNSAWIPDILLQNVYLRPFRAAMDAGAVTLMTSFNTLNGVPATGNQYLLRQILRNDWKFDGMVVSDYEAVRELIPHGYAADARDAARKALRAGVDMEMVSTAYFDHLKGLVQSKDVEVKAIDEAVRNILRLKFRLGLFDGRAQPTAPLTIAPASLTIAERLATESVVLLKNQDNLLPLSKSTSKIAVIGPLADSPVDQMGTWSMDGRPEDVQTPLAALRRLLGSERVIYSRAMKNSPDSSTDGFREAVDAARSADVAVLFLGEEQILSGEARSRAFLDLPGAQEMLVNSVAGTGKPVVAVILAGRPLTFHPAATRAGAILYAWHPGTMGGPAIARLLLGDASPSGKLALTFPRTVGQVPIYYSHLNTGRPASASELGIPLGDPADPRGYTSKYIDVDFTPEYPFGYGLSYTTFKYSETRASSAALPAGGRVIVSAEVTNSGTRPAEEVVQLYVSGPTGGSVSRPVRELKGFRRVSLGAGEKKLVEFSIGTDELAFYDEQLRFSAQPGNYRAWVAPDSASGAAATFALK